MFNFFSKRENENFSFLKTDIHSHTIFGLDDGAKNAEHSLKLISSMASAGFTSLVTTPHVHSDFYPNTRDGILTQYNKVKKILEDHSINIKYRTAAEYMINDGFMQLLEDKEDFLTVYKNYVLVEMSYLAESPFLHDALFQLQARGYTPILAHPERYNFYHENYDQFRQLKEKGCLLQLNTIAITGYYGSHVKKTAIKLLEDGMYDYCGSDMHHSRHFEALKSILSSAKLLRLLKAYPFRNKEIEDFL